MIGLIVLTFIPAVAAVMFWLRARREMRARLAAEARLAELERSATADAAAAAAPHARSATSHVRPASGAAASTALEPRSGTPAMAAPNDATAADAAATFPVFPQQVLGVVSHELRSPISAILGYQELLAEGIFGPLDPRAADAVGRIRHSAVQLLNLTDGMVELARGNADDKLELETIDLAALLAECLENAASEGAGRSVNVTSAIGADLPTLTTDAGRLRRVVELLLAAAMKVSPNAELRLEGARTENGAVIAVTGARLDAERDVPGAEGVPFRTGAALRIAMAQAGAATLGAHVEVDPSAGALRVRLVD